MSTHPNAVPTYNVTAEVLDQICSRDAQQLIGEKEAQRRALEWPGQVENTLGALVASVAALDARLAAFEARTE